MTTSPAIPSRLDLLMDHNLDKIPPDILREIDELIALEEANPTAVYFVDNMSPGQREFHECQAQNRLLRAANKVGKTHALSAEIWGWVTGTHPYNDHWNIPTPCTILYVCADLANSYAEDVCIPLRELEPPGLDPACSYDSVRGYTISGRSSIRMQNGSKVIFRSGHMDGKSLEGIWAHAVVINEPPKMSKWGGIMRAAALTNAPVAMAFTPVGDDLSWLRKIVEEDEETKDLWEQTIIELSPENVPWRSEEDIRNQIANCASWEREQRIYAAWEGTSPDRAYDAFNQSCVSTELPTADVQIVLGLDHGERRGSEACVVAAIWKDPVTKKPCAYLLDEYLSPGATTPETDARHIERMLHRHGISLNAVKAAVGDVNSAGKLAAGTPLNQVFEQAFADLNGTRQPPFRIKKPRKRPGSILAGIKSLNFGFADGRYRIHPNCDTAINSYSHWRGTDTGPDKQYTHVLDAARYVLGDWMDTSRAATVVPIKVM